MFEAATRVCKPGALCQNPGFGFQKYKIWFSVRVFLTWHYSECEVP